MTVNELNQKTTAAVDETRNALQTVYNALNQGQKKQIIKDTKVKDLFELYGIQCTTR